MRNLSKICIDDVSTKKKNVWKINTAFNSVTLLKYVKKGSIETKLFKIMRRGSNHKLVNRHQRLQV